MNKCFKEMRAMKGVCSLEPRSPQWLRDHDYTGRHLSCVSRPTIGLNYCDPPYLVSRIRFQILLGLSDNRKLTCTARMFQKAKWLEALSPLWKKYYTVIINIIQDKKEKKKHRFDFVYKYPVILAFSRSLLNRKWLN